MISFELFTIFLNTHFHLHVNETWAWWNYFRVVNYLYLLNKQHSASAAKSFKSHWSVYEWKNRTFAAYVSKNLSNVMFTTLTSYKIVSKTLSEICRCCDFIKSRTIIGVSTYTNGNLWLSKLISGAMRGIQTSKMSIALSLRCALSKYKLYYFSWLCSRNKEDDELKLKN